MTMKSPITRDIAINLDKDDPLAKHRAKFDIPEDIIYLDGNSLGVLPRNVHDVVSSAITHDWGQRLIRSWNEAGWIDLPTKVGSMIAPLIGADAHQVTVADSTSINLFKVLSAALSLNPERKKIITEKQNFPTDNYIAEGVIKQMGQDHELVLLDSHDDISVALDHDVAVLMLTHINYKNGRMHDMRAITKAAHDAGAVVIWDLAHSAGAVPLFLDDIGVDFAVGCGYKYLNGGPGAPAFLYVAERHLGGFKQPLSGWFAHQSPFAFEETYAPSNDIKQYLCGTPPVLSLLSLESALSAWSDVDMNAVRAKSLAQTDFFIALLEDAVSSHGLSLITPKTHEERGSQISFAAEEGGYAIMAALIDEGVIGDFRAPNILRFGFTPLYTTYCDVWDAAQTLIRILDHKSWDQPKFHKKKKVT